MTREKELVEAGTSRNRRFHDLDALRAFAMLLGIVLHGGMSFWLNFIWPAQDINMNNELFQFLNHVIHGFRMPLFFMISGYFTMMMWKKRGFVRLMQHRFMRVVVPLVAGYLILIPIMEFTAAKGTPKKIRNLARTMGEMNQQSRDSEGSQEFIGAATRGDLEQVQKFIEDGMDVNVQGDDGGTALHSAVFFGHAPIVEYLREMGADNEIRNKDGLRASDLMATEWEIVVFVGGLVQMDMDRQTWSEGRGRIKEIYGNSAEESSSEVSEINQLDATGVNRLHLAILARDENAVKGLIDMGADVNFKSADGSTPLHLATFVGADQIFMMLREAGGDLSIPNSRNESIEQVSRLNWETVQLIASFLNLELNKDQWESGITAIRANIASIDSESMDLAISDPDSDTEMKAEAEPSDFDDDGLNPLHRAILAGDVDQVESLLKEGTSPDRKTRDGTSPLHLSVFLGMDEIYQLLVANGADLSVTDNEGKSVGQMMQYNWDSVSFFADLDQTEWNDGRQKIGNLLANKGIKVHKEEKSSSNEFRHFMAQYRGLAYHFKLQHLWFLNYLIFLVIGFAMVVPVWQGLKLFSMPGWVTSFPGCMIWLFPLTMFWQTRMTQTWGPDTTAGWLPWWSVFGYYATFFTFGAMCFGRQAFEEKLGKNWIIYGIFSVILLFGGLHFLDERTKGDTNHLVMSGFAVLYGWFAIFTLMGIFRRFFSSESGVVRYLSDSSYWLYLAHQPLLYVLQIWVSDWDLPAELKFVFVCSLTIVILLALYELIIRYSVIGTVLNGKKRRKPKNQAVSG